MLHTSQVTAKLGQQLLHRFRRNRRDVSITATYKFDPLIQDLPNPFGSSMAIRCQ
jgi:hypothetical protein